MSTVKIMRPTVETKFHIDMNWWQEQGRNLRVHVYSRLCPECKTIYSAYDDVGEMDWVDERTAEVTRVDALWHTLRTCCSTKPDYITEETPLTEAIFRTFLANGNAPLSPIELNQILGRRSPEVILKLLAGSHIYYGIRPIFQDTEETVSRS